MTVYCVCLLYMCIPLSTFGHHYCISACKRSGKGQKCFGIWMELESFSDRWTLENIPIARDIFFWGRYSNYSRSMHVTWHGLLRNYVLGWIFSCSDMILWLDLSYLSWKYVYVLNILFLWNDLIFINSEINKPYINEGPNDGYFEDFSKWPKTLTHSQTHVCPAFQHHWFGVIGLEPKRGWAHFNYGTSV